MRIFLTGPDGYVGGHVADVLVRDGHEVVALAHTPETARLVRDRGFAPLEATLEDGAALARAAGSVDAVLHLAASSAPGFAALNRRATEAMLDAAAPSAAFVMQGGSLVFGPHPTPAAKPPFRPPPPLAERAAFEQSVLDATLGAGARRFVVYGGFVYGDGGGVFPLAMARAAAAGGAIPLPGDGSAAWSLVHVRDWAELLVRAATSGAPGGEPIFASARVATMAEVTSEMSRATGLPVVEVPADALSAVLGPLGASLVVPSAHSDAPARALGWRPGGAGLGEEFRALLEGEVGRHRAP